MKTEDPLLKYKIYTGIGVVCTLIVLGLLESSGVVRVRASLYWASLIGFCVFAHLFFKVIDIVCFREQRKEREQIKKRTEIENQFLSLPVQTSGLFLYSYIRCDNEFGIQIVGYHGFDEDNVMIPECIGNHRVLKIGYRAFAKTGIKAVTLSDSVIEIGKEAFNGCSGLKQVQFSGSLRKIDDKAFTDCENLKTVTLPEGLETLGEFVFFRSGIQSISFPSTLREISAYCCSACKCLTHVHIKEGVKEISMDAFHCEGYERHLLERVMIPSSVEHVDDEAFNNRVIRIGFKGRDTTGKHEARMFNAHSNGYVYCVLPGSAMQRYARMKNISVKPLSEF